MNTQIWHLSINFDKTKIMVFGTRQDQRFKSNLGCYRIDICTDFKYLGVICSRNRHSTKHRNIMLSKLGRHCMYFLNEFVILIFQLICSCIYLTMLFYLLHYMVVKYGALNVAKLLKIYIMISFINKCMEFIDLHSIFKDYLVISSIPNYFNTSETPIICYKYNV